MKETDKMTDVKQDKEFLRERCFVITPIGGNGEPIRRHIDGIIKASIEPVLESYGYEVVAAHTINESGSIDKQIFREIYEDKLVVANLTQNNPNVMYELAVRHCFGKPVIIIAEDGSFLPFDILRERTIFYVNDAQGTLELQEKLRRALEAIDFKKQGSPIHDIIQGIKKDAKVYTDVESGKVSTKGGTTDQEVMIHILEKLDELDTKIQKNAKIQNESENNVEYYKYYCVFSATKPSVPELLTDLDKNFKASIRKSLVRVHVEELEVREDEVYIEFWGKSMPAYMVRKLLTEELEKAGFKDVECQRIRRTILK